MLVILIFFSLMFQLELLYFANSGAIVSFLLQTTRDVSMTKPKRKLYYIDGSKMEEKMFTTDADRF